MAVLASLALHAALLAVVGTRRPVRLELLPSPLRLTLLDAGMQTAGPGERSPILRSAAPVAGASTVSPTTAKPPDIMSAKPSAVPPPRPATPPVPTAKPAKVPAKARPRIPAPSAKVSATAAPGNQAPVAENAGGDTHASLSSTAMGGTGTDARSSAPAWAPVAQARYEQLLFAWMDRHKQYPLLAQRRGLQGGGSLRVRIDRSGRVLERTLDQSTGVALLDQAALDMVRRASPFPKVPGEYVGSSFEFVAPIEYRLR